MSTQVANSQTTSLLIKSRPPELSPKDVMSRVEMYELMKTLGFSVSTSARRCSCLLHGGQNLTAFSWTESGQWFCFSCGKGGDRIALVMAVKKCGFRGAVAFLGSIAGVRVSVRRRSYDERRRFAQKRQRAERVAWQLRDEIVSLRGCFRDRLLRAERLQWIVGEHLRDALGFAEQEHYWSVLTRLAPVTTFFLAGVDFLDHSDTATLINFVRSSHSARRNAILGGLA